MDLAFRYPVIVQVITRNGYDTFYGYVPDFGLETFEAVDPGNLSQEIMFQMKLRRMIEEALCVFRTEGKEAPPIRSAQSLSYSASVAQDTQALKTVSVAVAAQMLSVHENTIRSLFDEGTLKGSLTKGGQRMILLSSISEEELRMKQRADLRALELRSKKKNSRRRKRYIEKQREEKLERLQKEMAEF